MKDVVKYAVEEDYTGRLSVVKYRVQIRNKTARVPCCQAFGYSLVIPVERVNKGASNTPRQAAIKWRDACLARVENSRNLLLQRESELVKAERFLNKVKE